ncbi:CE1 family esterase [Mucilaginibacter puniceus]
MKIIWCCLLLFSASSVMAQSQQKREEIIIDGMERAFVSYVPAGVKEKMPVVISLHGGFASPKGMLRLADFRPLADQDKFILVCPASKKLWHDGADNKGIDDVKFIDELITYILKTYNGDASMVYVTGVSNGGFMTSRLAAQLHTRIAAIAVVAATLNINEGYDLEKPMPVMYIHGTKDPIIPYNGGKKFGREMYSHDEIIKKWVTLNDCNPIPVVTQIPDNADDGTTVIKEEYSNPNGLKVVGYTINNGGHTWPGGRQYLPAFIIGKTTHNLNACQVIWDFFKSYQLKAAI